MSEKPQPRSKRFIVWAIVALAAVAYLNYWYFQTFYGSEGDHLRGSEFFRVLVTEAVIPVVALIGLATVLLKLETKKS